jgi:hypothetical protein
LIAEVIVEVGSVSASSAYVKRILLVLILLAVAMPIGAQLQKFPTFGNACRASEYAPYETASRSTG